MSRLYTMHAFFDGRRRAVSLEEICRHLECSPATAKRAIRELRDELGAPLAYDAELRGYRYEYNDGEPRFELPGMWFRADELAALVTLREMLVRLEPGVLGDILAPLARRLEGVLARRTLGLAEVAKRVRVISQHARAPGECFAVVARAVLSRRVLAFRYKRRTDDQVSEREVSPQRVIRYRGCWYLDAWCHNRKALRSFAMERIDDARVLEERALSCPEAELDTHYADAYGIFAGPATRIAVLRVVPRRARWVADEAWHPRQKGAFRDDGSYELRVPYGRPEELIADILRLGPDVEVMEPTALRNEVATKLAKASAVYGRVPSGAAGRESRKKARHRVRI